MKEATLVLLLILVLSLFHFPSIAKASTNNDIKVGVLYYPWYMPGNGTYHWSNRSEWKVVEIPVKGFYSTNDSNTIEQQLNEMASVGIDFILLSWWGPTAGAKWEDDSCKLICSLIKQHHPDMKVFLMVEEVLFKEAAENSTTITRFYDYIKANYIDQYSSIYFHVNNRPLVTWWGCANITDVDATRNLVYTIGYSEGAEVRIIGSQDYANWFCWRPPTYNGQSATPPVDQQDGFVFIEPRYDNTFKTMWNTNGTYGTAKYDQNLTEGLYDSQWTTVINRQTTNNDIKIVCIYSWNSFDERAAIEPCIDYTVPDLDHYYLLNKTKIYIDQLRTVSPLQDQINYTRDWVYALTVITVIFIVAIVYLKMRKPKIKNNSKDLNTETIA
jgi:hypothetical protein